MRVHVASLAAVALFAAAPAARGQAAQPPLSSCSYDACALRVEARPFFGAPLLVRGVDARRVARFGLRGPDLTRIVAGSDSAVAYARAFRPHQRRAAMAGLASSILGVTAVVIGSNDANDNNVWPASIAAAVLGVYAGVEARAAARELSRSVWWYNRDIPR